ncbi:MAG: aspartate kinase [Chloroflexota bacterium]|nr:aspartate kinase [Chloroflexota bacterium]
MNIIVQKYGGSCVADPARIKQVAERVVVTRDSGEGVVVVVSAMGDTTDRLLGLARDVSSRAPDREVDTLLASGEQASMALLAMAIADRGRRALSLSGSAAGIITDGSHGRARIVTVVPDRVRAALNEGVIVIVAGFQGLAQDTRDVTTLGRGGSDTTAVALAAALGARVCEIYTDVDGVHTADPRLVPQARMLSQISYDQMLELAANGARVLMPRAVECARRYNVPLHIRSLSGRPGTSITSAPVEPAGGPVERPAISGVAHDLDMARMTVSGLARVPGAAAAVLRALADDAIAVDMLIQSVASSGAGLELSFVLARRDVRVAGASLERLCGEGRLDGWACDERVGKVSLVGVGVCSHPWVSAHFFGALEDAGVGVMSAAASETRVAAVCEDTAVPKAVTAIHDAFSLDRFEQEPTVRELAVLSAAGSGCSEPLRSSG